MRSVRGCQRSHSSNAFAVKDQTALWGCLPGGSSFFGPHSLCVAKRLFWTATWRRCAGSNLPPQ